MGIGQAGRVGARQHAPRRAPDSWGAVLPYVGTLDREPVLSPEPGEVEAVYTIALSDLAADASYWEGGVGDTPAKAPAGLSFFGRSPSPRRRRRVGDDRAMVLRSLLTTVLAPPPAAGG